MAFRAQCSSSSFFFIYYRDETNIVSSRRKDTRSPLPPEPAGSGASLNHRLAARPRTVFVIWGEPRSEHHSGAAVVIAAVVFPPRHTVFQKYLFFFFLFSVVSAGEEASSWADIKESNELGKSECFGRVDREAPTLMSCQRCKLTMLRATRTSASLENQDAAWVVDF